MANCVVDDSVMRCNSLLPGAAITTTCGQGAQPKAMGGVILAGTYQLTAATDYDSSCPSRGHHAIAGKIMYRAGVLEEVWDNDPLCMLDAGPLTSPRRQRSTSTVSTEDVDFKGQETCRSFNGNALTSWSENYTATATTLVITSHTDVRTYTLDP